MIDDIELADEIEIEDADGFPLAGDEKQALARCEAVIAHGVQTFIEVGEALAEIRDGKLYRMQFATFDGYCKERWGIGRARAYQLIGAAVVTREMSTQVDNPPTNEKEARATKQIAPPDRAKAFKRADQLAGDGPRTAKHIQQAATEIAAPDLPPEFAIVQRRLAAHGIALTYKDGMFVTHTAEKSVGIATPTWSNVTDRLARLEDAPNPDPAAPAFRMTCPTCGELILNGIWGDLKECGSCHHARRQQPPEPPPAPAGDPLPPTLLALALSDLDATLPKQLRDAGYFWSCASPLIIAHTDGWRGDAPTVDQALACAWDRLRGKAAPQMIALPPFPTTDLPALMESISFILEALSNWPPSLRAQAAPTLGLLRAIGHKALEISEDSQSSVLGPQS